MTGPNLDPVIEAFERKDYRTATALLKPLYKTHPQDPWVQLYIARLQEVSKQPQKAEQLYRQLLKSTTNGKIISQARQGIQRIEAREREQREAAIAQASQATDSTALGCLILEPLDSTAKEKAIPAFARLMQLEPYSARLLLPSRHWRFYRTGPMALLGVYVQDLADIGVPAFCLSLTDIARYEVIPASHLDITGEQLILQPIAPAKPALADPSQSISDSPPPLSFPRSAVTQIIEGALPLFELVLDTGLKQGRLGPQRVPMRKEVVKDYAKVLDLHLPSQGKIVRICDRNYTYPQTNSSSIEQRYATIPQRWQRQLSQWQAQFPQSQVLPWHPIKAFQAFSDSALEQQEFLKQIDPHLRISGAATMTNRAEEELWDPAFHLYSCLRLWNQQARSAA